VRRELKLVHGLGTRLGTHKRIILLALAFDARCGGTGAASDRRLQNATELGARMLRHLLRELAIEGWITREGEYFTLAIDKMEANQRILLSAEYAAKRGDKPMSNNNPGCLNTPNRFTEGSL